MQVDQAIRKGINPVDLLHRFGGCLFKGYCLDREDLRLDAISTDPGGIKSEGLGGGCGHGVCSVWDLLTVA